jgi:hypothetical protein
VFHVGPIDRLRCDWVAAEQHCMVTKNCVGRRNIEDRKSVYVCIAYGYIAVIPSVL